jgi:GAF domain-containing protein
MTWDPTSRPDADQARRLGDLTRLARVTAELAQADTVDVVTKIVITHSADAVGATKASLTVLDEGGEHLRVVAARGYDEVDTAAWEKYPLSRRTPASDAVRTGERVVLVGAEEIAVRYPDVPEIQLGDRSVVCLPLRVATRTVGAIGLSFPGRRVVEPAELEFFEILADTCAQALERIAAQEAAARQTARLAFLADATTELASSLDYQATLQAVARLAVPTFADWCAIDLVEDGRLHRLAVEHVDPAKVRLAHELQERYPPDPNGPSGPWNVMRTGRSELIHEITDEMLVAGAVDEEHLRIARDLQLRSAITVPLAARGRVLGVITWVSAESERLYGPDDLSLAEDLARRAAVAIDNSQLHSETLAASERLQHAVLPAHLPAIPGWDLASFYSPSGRTEVGGDFYDAVPLADGRVVLFVGDVMGRGVAAAAAMAQMRAATRAYAAVDPSPAVVMGKLDTMFAQYPGEQLVTLVYMVADPSRQELVLANAGHPAPAILRADGTAEQLPIADGPPLDTFSTTRRDVRVGFRPGDTVLAFTDGLIERRDEDIDHSEGRVLGRLALLGTDDLTAGLEALADELREPTRDDDVAAVALRLHP